MWQKSYENIKGSRWNEDSNKFEKDAFFSATSWLVKSHHVSTSRCVRTGLYSCSQAHTVEVTCKQQKWRWGEEEDATYMRNSKPRIIVEKLKWRELVTYVVKILLALMDSSLKLQFLSSCKHFSNFRRLVYLNLWLHIVFFCDSYITVSGYSGHDLFA